MIAVFPSAAGGVSGGAVAATNAAPAELCSLCFIGYADEVKGDNDLLEVDSLNTTCSFARLLVALVASKAGSSS